MNTRTFRLFLSSTFSDFTAERQLLQTKVFPHMRKYCAEKGGYSFQPIDLRWGVSAEAQLDQKTLELCLNEVRSCKSHPYPNFLIMAGDRYGWVPLPYAIDKEELETLLVKMDDDEKAKILAWYHEDLNQIPASYIIKERSGEYEADEAWGKVESELRDILQSSVKASSLSDEQRRKYFFSATEAEVEEGIINYLAPTPFQKSLEQKNADIRSIDSDFTFGFLRSIDGDIEGSVYGDDNVHEATAFKQRIAALLPEQNILLESPKLNDGDQLDTDYLERFEKHLIAFLEKSVDRSIEQMTEVSGLEEELQAQSHHARQKRARFQGREEALAVIDDYLRGENNQPLVIYGPSGQGKSALMAKAIEQEEQSSRSRILYRFVGATPQSATTAKVLSSLLEELGIDIYTLLDQYKPDYIQTNIMENYSTQPDDDIVFNYFTGEVHDALLGLESHDTSYTIFIDAVDQLHNRDHFFWLPKALPKNVKVVISALDDEHYPDDSLYLENLRETITNLYELTSFDTPLPLMHELLQGYNRTIQPHQETYLLQQYATASSPLYLAIAAEEMRYWSSSDKPQEHGGFSSRLADTQKGVIAEYIANLSSLHHHDKLLVEKVLGFIYASKNGLSESELLALLSTDAEFVETMAPETWHENPTKELPIVILTRLLTQLRPFLSHKFVHGEDLLYFFHREFEEVIASLPSQRSQHEALVTATEKLIEKFQGDPFESNRWGRLYMTLMTEYVLRYDDEEMQEHAAFFLVGLDDKEWFKAFMDVGVRLMSRAGNALKNAIWKTGAIAYELLFIKDPDQWYIDYSSFVSINPKRMDGTITHKMLEYMEKTYHEDPDEWAEKYILALHKLVAQYAAKGFTDAITATDRALAVVDKHFAEEPDRFILPLMKELSSAAMQLHQQNMSLKQAALFIDKALDIFEKYATVYDLAGHAQMALMSTRFNFDADRIDEAAVSGEKHLEISEKLYAEDPAGNAEAYGTSLQNLQVLYEKTGRSDAAEKLREKYEDLSRQNAASNETGALEKAEANDSDESDELDTIDEEFSHLIEQITELASNAQIDEMKTLIEEAQERLVELSKKHPIKAKKQADELAEVVAYIFAAILEAKSESDQQQDESLVLNTTIGEIINWAVSIAKEQDERISYEHLLGIMRFMYMPPAVQDVVEKITSYRPEYEEVPAFDFTQLPYRKIEGSMDMMFADFMMKLKEACGDQKIAYYYYKNPNRYEAWEDEISKLKARYEGSNQESTESTQPHRKPADNTQQKQAKKSGFWAKSVKVAATLFILFAAFLGGNKWYLSYLDELEQKQREEWTRNGAYPLTITAPYDDYKVRILNIKPKYYDGIELKPGIYTIEVSKKGYKSEVFDVDIVDDAVVYEDVYLRSL